MAPFPSLLRRQAQPVSPGPRPARGFARLFVPGARYYLLASALFVVAFGIVPFSLYAHSGEEWAFAPELLLRLAGLGLLALVAAVVVLRLIAVPSAKATKALSIGLFCLGIFTLLAHVYAPVAIGPLDGGQLKSSEPFRYTLLESVLLIGAALLFLLLWRARGVAIASLFAVTLWLVGIGYLVAILWPTYDGGAEASLADAQSLSSSGACGVESNVYHIVLDALATDAFLEVVDTKAWIGEFDGFDLFFNNISNYMMTVSSMASYLTGKFYYSGDVREWRKAAAEGLFRRLDASGFRLWMYAPLEEWKPRYPYVDVFRSNVGVYSERIGAPQGEFYEFLSVWLTSLAPNMLTNEVIPVTAKPADSLFALLTSSRWSAKEDLKGHGPERRARLLKTGFHAFATTLLLEQAALDEPVRQSSCQYVYAHAMLPHDPFVIDGRCRYVGPWNSRPRKVSTRQAYLQQVECAVRKVIDFLHVLRRLNRYDAATIVVHGDHGAPTLRFRSSTDTSGAEVLGRPRAGMLARVQALLMIKRPHAQHRLNVTKTPTQLVDIYPTIFDVLGLDLQPAGVHGRSVYATAASPREARFALDPERRYGPNLIEVRIDDPADLVSSNLTVIGPSTDPAVWREEVRRAAESAASPDISGMR
jgi:hypothetical protein